MSQSGRTIIGRAMHVDGATLCEHQPEAENRCRKRDHFCTVAVGKTRVIITHLFNHLNQNTSHNDVLKSHFRKRQMQSSLPDPKRGVRFVIFTQKKVSDEVRRPDLSARPSGISSV